MQNGRTNWPRALASTSRSSGTIDGTIEEYAGAEDCFAGAVHDDERDQSPECEHAGDR